MLKAGLWALLSSIWCLEMHAIPVRVKIGLMGSYLCDSFQTNDPFHGWTLPKAVDAPEPLISANKDQLVSSAMGAAGSSGASSAIQVNQQRQAQAKAAAGPAKQKTHYLPPHKAHGPVIGGIIEAEIRSNNWVLGLDFGILYGLVQPEYKKQVQVLSIKDKKEIVEDSNKYQAHTGDAGKGQKAANAITIKVLEEDEKVLSKHHINQEEFENDKHKTFVLNNSIMQQRAPLVFGGAYIGRHFGDFSFCVLLNAAARKTKLAVHRETEVPIPDLGTWHTQHMHRSGETNFSALVELGQPVWKRCEDDTVELDISVGAMIGCKIAYNFTDDFQMFVLAGRIWFFDGENFMANIADNLNKMSQPKGVPHKEGDPVMAPPPDTTVKGRNGDKTFVVVGMSFRVI